MIANRLQGKHILIVDDEEPLLDLYIDICDEYGAQAVKAVNGLEAIARFQEAQHLFDLVIMDIKMPKMDGISAAKKIMIMKPQQQIVFISGYSENVELKTLRQLPNVDFLPKPFLEEDLLHIIAKNL